MYRYKMVQIPPNVAIQAKGLLGKAPSPASVAAEYLEKVVNDRAKEGWEFYRIDEIGIISTPGCLAGLFGAQQSVSTYYVVTFRMAA